MASHPDCLIHLTTSQSYGYPIPVEVVWAGSRPMDWNHFNLIEPPIGEFVHLSFRPDGPWKPKKTYPPFWVNANEIRLIVFDSN